MSALILDDELVNCLDRIKETLPKISIDERSLSVFEKSFRLLDRDDIAVLNHLGNVIQGLLIENGFVLIKGFEFDFFYYENINDSKVLWSNF